MCFSLSNPPENQRRESRAHAALSFVARDCRASLLCALCVALHALCAGLRALCALC